MACFILDLNCLHFVKTAISNLESQAGEGYPSNCCRIKWSQNAHVLALLLTQTLPKTTQGWQINCWQYNHFKAPKYSPLKKQIRVPRETKDQPYEKTLLAWIRS